MRPENTKIIITDALNGKNIDCINIDLYDYSTLSMMLEDIFYKDFKELQHGILIKYGIEP